MKQTPPLAQVCDLCDIQLSYKLYFYLDFILARFTEPRQRGWDLFLFLIAIGMPIVQNLGS